MTNYALTVEKLSKSFGDYEALKNIEFGVNAHELICIVGPSGSGKSTLLNIIAGIEMPSAGEVFYFEKPLSALPAYKRDFGVVFQGLNLFPHLSVFDNIAFSLKTSRHKTESKIIAQRVSELVTMFKLDGLEKRLPTMLSGGERQRVAIARALAYKPQLLLLDEPFSALDRLLKERLLLELKNLQLKLGLTIIYVTHDQYEAATISDKVILLNNGQIQQFDTYEKLYLDPRNKFVREFIGYNNVITGKIESETKTGFTVNIGAKNNIRVLKKDFLTIGQYVEILIRPEDIFMDSSSEVTDLNTIEVRVVKSTKADLMYKIIVELPDGSNWHFFEKTGNLKNNQNIILSFLIEKTIFYN